MEYYETGMPERVSLPRDPTRHRHQSDYSLTRERAPLDTPGRTGDHQVSSDPPQGIPGRWAAVADLDGLEQGAFICDRSGHVLMANESAERLLQGRIGQDHRIRFMRSSDDQAFTALLKTTLDAARTGETSAMACELAASPANVVLRAMRLRREVGLPSRPAALVLIEKPRGDPADALRRDFGLTATEARVAIALAEGIGIEEVCAKLGVARATIRSHLKSIFRKTDTRGQVQLVVLVSKLWRMT